MSDGTVRCWGLKPGSGTEGSPSPAALPLGVSSPITEFAVNGPNVCVKSTKIVSESQIQCIGEKMSFLMASVPADDLTGIFVNDDAVCWYNDASLYCANAETSASQVAKQAPVGVGGNRVCTSTGTSVDCSGTFNSDLIFSHIILDVKDIWVAPDHACFANADLFVCRGNNDQGQLGVAQTTTDAGTGDAVASYTRDLFQVRLVDVGQARTCFVLENEPTIVQCWGPNLWGQQGNVSVVGLPATVRQLAAGDRHVCALVGEGAAAKVYCWGNNERGQLGNGTTGPTADPVLVTFLP